MKTNAMTHPIDEPCPPGCPTRLDEIADYLNGWLAAYTSEIALTGDDVREALCAPGPHPVQSVERIIVETERTWE